MPDLKQAELIGGVVLMPSPVGRTHGSLHGLMTGWLFTYSETTRGTEFGIETTWLMDRDDIPQPDLHLRILPEAGGQSKDAGDYSRGAPELVVEVSGSSSSRDLGVKLDLYRRAGVREYLTVLLKPRRIVWRQLFRGKYRELPPDPDGLLRSKVFPGLWLDPASLWDRNRSVRDAVERGVRSPGHAVFVRRLASRARK